MASGWYVEGLAACLDGTIDLDDDTIKVMLVDNNYTFDTDHDYVDDISGDEITATNYTGGFGGAGRKTATIVIQADTTNDRVEVVLSDLTWSSLGGAANDTVGGAVLIKEVTADSDSIPIAFWDLTDTTTNGGDFTLDFSSDGNLQISSV